MAQAVLHLSFTFFLFSISLDDNFSRFPLLYNEVLHRDIPLFAAPYVLAHGFVKDGSIQGKFLKGNGVGGLKGANAAITCGLNFGQVISKADERSSPSTLSSLRKKSAKCAFT